MKSLSKKQLPGGGFGMMETYSMRDLEAAYSVASDQADRAIRSGDVQTFHEAIDRRARVQAEINLRHAQHNLFNATTLEALDCARSELRLAREACMGSAIEAAGSGLKGVRTA